MEYLRKMLPPNPLRLTSKMTLRKCDFHCAAPLSFQTNPWDRSFLCLFSHPGYSWRLRCHICIQVKGYVQVGWVVCCEFGVSACVCGCMWHIVTAAAGHSSYSISCWRGNTISFAVSKHSYTLLSPHTWKQTADVSKCVCEVWPVSNLGIGRLACGGILFLVRAQNVNDTVGVTITLDTNLLNATELQMFG